MGGHGSALRTFCDIAGDAADVCRRRDSVRAGGAAGPSGTVGAVRARVRLILWQRMAAASVALGWRAIALTVPGERLARAGKRGGRWLAECFRYDRIATIFDRGTRERAAGVGVSASGASVWAEREFVRTVNPMGGAERELFVLVGVSALQEGAPKAPMEVRIAGRKSKCARVRMAFEFEDVAEVGEGAGAEARGLAQLALFEEDRLSLDSWLAGRRRADSPTP